MTETVELTEAPSLLGLYAKAPLAGLRGGDALPDRELVLRDAAIDPDHLAAYARVCGQRYGSALPGTFLHVLAFPLAVRLMTEPSFPFALAGLVHVANRIEHLRPVEVTERPTFRVRAAGLRPHPKGRQLDLLATAEIDDEVVWRGASTYLHREAGGGEPDEADQPGAMAPAGEADLGAPVARWRVPADIGRRYAAVSGDRNPIHMAALTAKAFGFPRAIAHGMWTAARALGALEGRLPEAYTYDVRFQTPLLLPSSVALRVDADGADHRLGVDAARSGKPHLRAVVAAR